MADGRWSKARPVDPDGKVLREILAALDETPWGKVIIHMEDGKPVRLETNNSKHIG